jgi:hypothetical protein
MEAYFDWAGYINPESVANRPHQESRIALASVSTEIPCANEAGTESIAAFQTASQLSGFSQPSVEFNITANFDNNLERNALFPYPDGMHHKVVQNSTSIVKADWNSMISSLDLRSDCDFLGKNDQFSTPPWNESFQQSQEQRKIPISVLNPFRCPQCFNPFSSEQRLRYFFCFDILGLVAEHYRHHVQKFHGQIQHPNICNTCGSSFTLPKDLERHQLRSCSNRSARKRMFACRCGKEYSRRDGLLRHITDKHHD